MKILLVAAEANPLIKVGGLADVVGSLPQALRKLGHDVRILIPQYARLDTRRFPLTAVKENLQLSLQGENLTFNLNRTAHAGVPVYTLENRRYFGSQEIYTASDLDRFFFFSQAVFELLPQIDWQPDIVHCHDWHTALLVMWLKKAAYPYASVFTIHNLAHQGQFDINYLSLRDLKKDWDLYLPEALHPRFNFMSQAILHADQITTVSETYAREILTPQMGMGMESLLRHRQDSLSGIINGLDYREWDPQRDVYLPANFNAGSIEKRALNKAALQQRAALPVDEAVPLIGMVQRMDGQKGMDILGQSIEPVIRETGAQFIILGQGQENYEVMLHKMASRFPQNVAVFTTFEEPLAHHIYGGCDMFLMPSQFEPCGLGQLIAMRYGALPVVRHTGGLVDTVPGFSPDLKEGHGFIFHEYSAAALIRAVKSAAAVFREHHTWLQAVQRIMNLDFSWQSSARPYENLYQKLLEKSQRELSIPRVYPVN